MYMSNVIQKKKKKIQKYSTEMDRNGSNGSRVPLQFPVTVH